jgi:hypothetical protein
LNQPVPKGELGALLNTLLEAERAGAKLLGAYIDELPQNSPAWTRLRAIQADERRNCAVLIHLLLEAEVAPSSAVGDFYEKGLAIRDWRQRLEFLNRGQLWVTRRIAEAVPLVAAAAGKDALLAMHASHLLNVDLCEELNKHGFVSSKIGASPA